MNGIAFDLSNSLAGAGNIGGLLAIWDDNAGTSNMLVASDGNGNVTQVLKRSDGSLLARFEYDAYGNPVVAAESYAANMPLRFSSKWFDAETGLGYWGYRWYHSRLGRWMSRDHDGFSTSYSVSSPLIRRHLDQQVAAHQGQGKAYCNSATGKVVVQVSEHVQGDCVEQHERKHETDMSSCCARFGKCVKKHGHDSCFARWSAWMSKNMDWLECRAYRREISCLDGQIAIHCKCPLASLFNVRYSEADCKQLQSEREFAKRKRDEHCGAAGDRKRCPFDSDGDIRTSVWIGELP